MTESTDLGPGGPTGPGGQRALPLVRLGDVRPLHAMTVHRAQGSQCEQVTVVLPYAASALATRQTLYTALTCASAPTRASAHVRIIGSAEAFRACVERPIARAAGLRDGLRVGPLADTVGAW